MYARNIGFIEASRLAFQNYFNFQGRAQRAEYWWFQLLIVIVSIVASIFDVLTMGVAEDGLGFFGLIWSLVTIIPSLSIGWRRMHDVGKSGWWNFLSAAPLAWMIAATIAISTAPDANKAVIGTAIAIGLVSLIVSVIYVLILLIRDSDPYDNRFGPSVKYHHADDFV